MLRQSLTAEAIGTFALCLIGGGSILANTMMPSGGPGLAGIAIAHGIILSIAVTAAMNVSGGHINPAVTFAMMATRRIDPAVGLQYIIAQLAGGMVAGVLLANVFFAGIEVPGGGETVVQAAFNGTPNYSGEVLGGGAMFKAIAIEAVATFLLVFAVFGTAVDPRHPNVGGFGVGLTITALIMFCGPLTGASMNPARTFGTGFLMGGVFWAQQVVYWVGPVAGGVIAGLVYDALIMQPKSDRA